MNFQKCELFRKRFFTKNVESACNFCRRLEISFGFISISGITVRFDCTLELFLLPSMIGVTDVNEQLDTGRDRRRAISNQ